MTAEELRRRMARLEQKKKREQEARVRRTLITVAAVLFILLLMELVLRYTGRIGNAPPSDEGAALPGYGVELPAYVTEDLIPVNEWSRPGTPLTEIHGVVIHYVGNPGTTAKANRNYFASLADGREEIFASSHFVVGLEGEVVQSVPLTEIAHASKERNVDTISIEVCHPDEGGQFSPVTYDRVVELTAWLCETFDLKVETDVIRHYDVTGKLCPLYYVEHPDAWDKLRGDVAQRVDKDKQEAEGTNPEDSTSKE